jgi:hypothetical protein
VCSLPARTALSKCVRRCREGVLFRDTCGALVGPPPHDLWSPGVGARALANPEVHLAGIGKNVYGQLTSRTRLAGGTSPKKSEGIQRCFPSLG